MSILTLTKVKKYITSDNEVVEDGNEKNTGNSDRTGNLIYIVFLRSKGRSGTQQKGHTEATRVTFSDHSNAFLVDYPAIDLRKLEHM